MNNDINIYQANRPVAAMNVTNQYARHCDEETGSSDLQQGVIAGVVAIPLYNPYTAQIQRVTARAVSVQPLVIIASGRNPLMNTLPNTRRHNDIYVARHFDSVGVYIPLLYLLMYAGIGLGAVFVICGVIIGTIVNSFHTFVGNEKRDLQMAVASTAAFPLVAGLVSAIILLFISAYRNTQRCCRK